MGFVMTGIFQVGLSPAGLQREGILKGHECLDHVGELQPSRQT